MAGGGVKAYAETILYAKEKGLIVIGDVKRGDVPSTAEAYAAAHIGETRIGEITAIPFAADAATVNPYMGSDSLLPFIQTAKGHGKGIFVLVKPQTPSPVNFKTSCAGKKTARNYRG